MTEEDVKNWKVERDIARQSGNPELLQIAYDHRDDLMMNCIQRQADRVKALIDHKRTVDTELKEVKNTVSAICTKLDEHSLVVEEVKKDKIKGQGIILALKILGWISAAGGSGAIGWILAVANKANGIQ